MRDAAASGRAAPATLKRQTPRRPSSSGSVGRTTPNKARNTSRRAAIMQVADQWVQRGADAVVRGGALRVAASALGLLRRLLGLHDVGPAAALALALPRPACPSVLALLRFDIIPAATAP
eukprot:CAMPEP_0170367772 /NCGR_PEP_ID=MMETSP0117_2-20130122/7104_1 /TAXON_ID=400756 /ORGANISM="Durinskia baltica, Strain CSIRO CS-38" /LENGTH=119 /DNA_ID=CAMNT_0010622399 /DNA_START=169 /DNA_END=525 /DNA_ORIENTATION=+